MPQHPHNDRTQQRLLPWIALIGFLGVALYALLPADTCTALLAPERRP